MNIDMSNREQEYTLNVLLSDTNAFAKCIRILDSRYFTEYHQRAVKVMKEHYEKYNDAPTIDRMNTISSETQYKRVDTPPTEVERVLSNVESFCRLRAMYAALEDSVNAVSNSHNKESVDFSMVMQNVEKALSVSLEQDLGMDVFGTLRENFERSLVQNTPVPSLITELDKRVELLRGTVTLIIGGSGEGKSVIMTNLANNLAIQNLNVVVFTLELSEEMTFVREAAIATGYNVKEWRDNVDDMINIMDKYKNRGTLYIKKLDSYTDCLDMKAYLDQYFMKFGYYPDAVVADYLELMNPNGRKRDKVNEDDPLIVSEFRSMVEKINAVGIIANQKNTVGMANKGEPSTADLSGGAAQIKPADNVLYLRMTPEQRNQGEMAIYFMKTRSSSAVGTYINIQYNSQNLIISDLGQKGPTINILSTIVDRIVNNVTFGDNLKLPGVEIYNDPTHQYIEDDFSIFETLTNTRKKPVQNVVQDIVQEKEEILKDVISHVPETIPETMIESPKSITNLTDKPVHPYKHLITAIVTSEMPTIHEKIYEEGEPIGNNVKAGDIVKMRGANGRIIELPYSPQGCGRDISVLLDVMDFQDENYVEKATVTTHYKIVKPKKNFDYYQNRFGTPQNRKRVREEQYIEVKNE